MNMSFWLTTAQVQARTKTVTRRERWVWLQPGAVLQPIVKGQGLRKGDRVTPIGGLIRVLSVRREPLWTPGQYDDTEAAREGFPLLTFREFCDFYVVHHRGTLVERTLVTRIEFEYV